MLDLLHRLWPLLLLAAHVVTAVLASGHAVIWKRDPRSAVSWVGLIWLTPFVGSLLYASFGINRIERRALSLSLRRNRRRAEAVAPYLECTDEELREYLGAEDVHLAEIAKVGRSLLGRPLLEGNVIAPLREGEEAFPAMLASIDAAEKSITLLVYILELDQIGGQFVDALGRAAARGVEVRVLLDAVGSGKDLGKLLRAFQGKGVRAAAFLPVRIPWRTRYMNLRNHRKIVVVDGRHGYTGGMNIRDSHLLKGTTAHKEQDVHFRLEGPVVEHLQEAFVDDWAFTTGESLVGEKWFPAQKAVGKTAARGVPFDPGEKLDIFRNLLVGAVGVARRTIRIVTPYFLPEAPLVTALNVAALRGVEVEILIPARSDYAGMAWATQAMLWQLLIRGCKIWKTGPPFDHSKLIVIDGAWVFFGSMNVDPRSMRLNFEMNIEAYDRELGRRIDAIAVEKRDQGKAVTLKFVNGRPLWMKLRDGIARLFTPYL
jgi:cardiolipin synthase A/B